MISKSSQDLVSRKERDLVVASMGVRANNSSNEPAEPQPECLIVGAAKPGEDVSGKRYSTMYLVQWVGFGGQQGEYSWLNDSDLGSCYGSLDGDLDNEPVHSTACHCCSGFRTNGAAQSGTLTDSSAFDK